MEMNLTCTVRPVYTGLVSFLVGLLSVGSQGLASEGEPKPTITVVAVYPTNPRAARYAARVAHMAESAVTELQTQQLRPLANLLDADASARLQQLADQGAEALEAAKKLYFDLDSRAAERCDRALQVLEAADLSTNFPQMMKVWKWRIASLIANAKERLAWSELNLLLSVDPYAKFDPHLFSPDFIARAHQERDDVLARTELSYRVSTAPIYSRIHIDGQFRGITPLEVNLLPGEHFLTLKADGYRHFQKRIRPGESGVDVITLEEAPEREKYAFFLEAWNKGPSKKERNAAAISFARALSVDQILVLDLSGNIENGFYLQGTRLDAASGKEVLASGIKVSQDSESSKELLAWTKKLLGSQKSNQEVTASSWRWSNRYTGYTMVGAGAVVAGAGLYFGLKAKSINDEIRDLEVSDPNLESRKTTGRRYAFAANTCLVASLVIAGIGAYLATRSEPTPGKTLNSESAR
jgi:hypothetical protein